MTKPLMVLATFLTLAACGGIDPTTGEYTETDDALLGAGIYDPCLGWASVTPDATITMGSNITTRRRDASTYGANRIGSCGGRWIVGVDVPYYSSGCSNCSDTIDVAFGLINFPHMVASGDSDFPVPHPSSYYNGPTKCLTYRVQGSIYGRSVRQSNFTRIRTFDLRGTWTGSQCVVRDVNGNTGNIVQTLVPKSSTYQYRFVVTGSFDGDKTALRVRAQHPSL